MKTTKIIELSYSEIANLIGPIVKERVEDKVKVISIRTCRLSVASVMATATQQAQYPPMDPDETLKIEIEVAK